MNQKIIYQKRIRSREDKERNTTPEYGKFRNKKKIRRKRINVTERE